MNLIFFFSPLNNMNRLHSFLYSAWIILWGLELWSLKDQMQHTRGHKASTLYLSKLLIHDPQKDIKDFLHFLPENLPRC